MNRPTCTRGHVLIPANLFVGADGRRECLTYREAARLAESAIHATVLPLIGPRCSNVGVDGGGDVTGVVVR
jgi:hypothetical protein